MDTFPSQRNWTWHAPYAGLLVEASHRVATPIRVGGELLYPV